MVYLLRKNIKTKRLSGKLDHTKLRPYRIKKKLGPVTIKLDLLKEIRIHLVFYISLLEPTPRNARPGPVEINKETQELMYKVERIRKHKIINGVTHYLIH
jgi:hypothetical protein